MAKTIHEYAMKSTHLSIDTDYKPFRETIVQKSARRIPDTVPSMCTKLTPDFDVDRIIQYFQKQCNGPPILH